MYLFWNGAQLRRLVVFEVVGDDFLAVVQGRRQVGRWVASIAQPVFEPAGPSPSGSSRRVGRQPLQVGVEYGEVCVVLLQDPSGCSLHGQLADGVALGLTVRGSDHLHVEPGKIMVMGIKLKKILFDI